MTDPGKGPGEPALPPLFLDQTEARRAKRIWWEHELLAQFNITGLCFTLLLL